jgi:hypothetical protein
MLPINNHTMNVPVHYERTQQKIIPVKNYKKIKKQLNKIFFTAINLEKNKAINTSQQHKSIQNESFYDKVTKADLDGIKDLLITEVETFIELDKFYCGDANHLQELRSFKQRISDHPSKSVDTNAVNDMKNTLYNLYELNRVLKNLQYEIQKNQTATIISKEAIGLRLDECLGSLKNCWAGISSRLQHEYEFLSANQQGLLGVIYTAKKDMFKEVTFKYIDSNDVHKFNRYNNTIAEKFGLNIIEDTYARSKLDTKNLQKFTALLEVELSPAAITANLAERTHSKLAEVLARFDKRSWLIQDLTDDELDFEMELINENVFSPVNALFNITATQKLTINKIINSYEEKGITIYSLKHSKEKINLWLADNIIPNTVEILVSSIDTFQENNHFNIKTISGIFFWVCYQQNEDLSTRSKSKIKVDYNNYTSLQLSHLLQIDFASLYKANDKQIIIDLVLQALSQTNNLEDILDFLVSDNMQVVLEDIPLFKQRVEKKLKTKLHNKTFNSSFQTTSFITNTITKAKYLLHFFYDIKDYHTIFKIVIDILNSKEISITDKIDIFQVKTTIGIPLIFALLINPKTNNFLSTYLNFILENKDFTDEQKLELVTAKTSDGNSIFNNAIKCHDFNIANEYINIILKHEKFTIEQKLDLITEKTSDGNSILNKAITDGYTIIFNKYINIILKQEKLTTEQKLEVLQLNPQEVSYLYSDKRLRYNMAMEVDIYKKAGAVERYINTMLAYNGFDSLQKIKIIQMLNGSNLNFYKALLWEHCKSSVKYIQTILEDKNFTPEQQLQYSIPILNMLIQNSDIENAIEFIYPILATDKFTNDQKFELVKEKTLCYLYKRFNMEFCNNSVTRYFKVVLAYNGFTFSQKAELIQILNDSILNKDKSNLYAVPPEEKKSAIIGYIQIILENINFTSEQKLNLLLAKEQEDYLSCLHLALLYDDHNILNSCINYVLNYDGFTVAEKLKFIRAESNLGVPGLFKALTYGSHEAVKIYIDTILNCSIFTKEQKLEIIDIKDFVIIANLFLSGYDKAVKVYMELILKYKYFSPKQKLNILLAKDQSYASSYLHLALSKNYYEMLGIYISYILNDDGFTLAEKLKFIRAENENGIPGLFQALKKNSYNAVQEYLNTIIDSSKIDVLEKIKIIRAKNQGKLGLSEALKNNYHKTVKVYIDTILKCNKFTEKQKLKLINTKTNDNAFSLSETFAKGCDETVQVYMNLILNYNNFSSKQKLKLIQIQGKKSNLDLKKANDYEIPTRELRSTTNYHYQVVYNYINTILNHREFNIKQKQQLCSILSSWKYYEKTVNNNNILTTDEKAQILSTSNCTIM